MDTLIEVISALLILAGIFTSLLPMISGPLISYVGLLALALTTKAPFGSEFYAAWGLVVVVLMILDNFIPAYGTKKLGGSAYGVWGSVLGALIGAIFFAPFGILAGPLVGAFVGEIIAGQSSDRALRSAIGSFVGFLFHTLLKVIATFMMAYYFVVYAL